MKWGVVECTDWRRQEIENKAYFLWVVEGRPNGRQDAHWLEAERQWEEMMVEEIKYHNEYVADQDDVTYDGNFLSWDECEIVTIGDNGPIAYDKATKDNKES